VSVIGGDGARMQHQAGPARWRPAATTWAAARELTRLGRVDVVHAHMTAAELAAVTTKPRHRAAIVATHHFASERGSGPTARLVRPLGRAINRQIAISNFVAASAPSDCVLLNGVAGAAPGPATRDRTVLVLQRLEGEKQTDVVLRAWAGSHLRHDGWTLAIAGRGSELAALQQLSADLGLAGTVEWTGFVDDPAPLLSRVSVLLAPAPAEPFGLTVVEAMARATPVIAAAGGAHGETLGADGWLFPPGDAVACAGLLDDLGQRDLPSYGSQLRKRQLERFDIEAHTDALLEIYRGLVP
jgi:glycosyltransferase involved in cell wall biosynthesis